jgi:hypothetical protein
MWFPASREEHRLKMFENRVLRRLFGRKRDEIIVCWRKLHNEKLHNLYSSPNDKVKEDDIGRACSAHE